jgi:tRNA (uracil-5-)-methyltransferase TRM9
LIIFIKDIFLLNDEVPMNVSYDAETTWDAISESFDRTRRTPWRQCVDFLQNLKPTDVLVDCGCGNGRHLLPGASCCTWAIGIDISRKLLCLVQRKAQEKGIENISLLHSDLIHIPLQDHSADAALCIASLHSIQGRDRRGEALCEIYRILKPNGTMLVSVWSRWQDRYRKYFLKQFFLRTREFGDIDILWRQHNLNIPRFYHLYSKNEFVRELRQAGFIVDSTEDARIHSKKFPDNFFAVVRKPKLEHK